MESEITGSHFDENDKVWIPHPDIKEEFLRATVKKVDRLYNTAIIVFFDEADQLDVEKKIELSQLQPASQEDKYSFLLTNLKIVNNPEILNYFKCVISKDSQYSYMNQSLFFINTGKMIGNPVNVEKCLDIVEEDSLDIMETKPNLAHFLSKLLFRIKKERKGKTLFLLGQKGSAKSVHFKFTVDFMQKVFLQKNEELKKKIKYFLSLIKTLSNNLNENGVLESFSFGSFKFIFSDSFELESLNYELISLYITFIGREKHMSGLPFIIYLTRTYYQKKGIKYDHLDSIYKQDDKMKEKAEEKVEKYYTLVMEAFEVV